MNKRYPFFAANMVRIFFLYLVGMAIFFLFRLAYLLRFGKGNLSNAKSGDIVSAFLRGFRFDTLVLCYFFAILILIMTIFSLFPGDRSTKIYINVSRIYTLLGFAVIILILLIDQEYYTSFQTHLNVVMFALFEGDTGAIFKSIWTDHPVVPLLLILCVLLFLIHLLLKQIQALNVSPSIFNRRICRFIFPIVIVIFLFIGARGSLGTFPLSIDDSTVSSNQFVNKITINGVFALKEAILEKIKSLEPKTPDEVLRTYNKASVFELISDYYHLPVGSNRRNYKEHLFKKTPKNDFLQNNPPHVVVVIMESFGGYYLDLHSRENNLLGELENHINKDILFRNFLSSTRGSIYSLECIILNSFGWPALSGTEQRFISYDSSAALPFKTAGYETIFITAGKLGWRNLADFIPCQHFDRTIGKSVIKKEIKGATECTWGVHDEYLYQFIFKLLKENSQKPKLIIATTKSNHTPFELPKNYQPFPLKIPDEIKDYIISKEDLAISSFTGYQYGNNCLGVFLSQIKKSVLAHKTIVATTGDHNSYTLISYDNPNIPPLYKHAVPFYLYVPQAYRPEKLVNQNVYGSHKDIFPTLYHLALSEAKYFCVGENMMSSSPKALFFGDHLDFVIAKPDIPLNRVNKIRRARRGLIEYYFAKEYHSYKKKPIGN
jgi:phosphoglycerol transferase MdoB-like AlkP superfamily enzyme